MEERRRAWRIQGRVQGVGYRYFAVRAALGFGLRGWTRNLPDGTVEVQAVGPEEALARLETALRSGPAHARVTELEALQPSPSLERAASFTIEY